MKMGSTKSSRIKKKIAYVKPRFIRPMRQAKPTIYGLNTAKALIQWEGGTVGIEVEHVQLAAVHIQHLCSGT